MTEYRNQTEVMFNSDHSKFVHQECTHAMAITDIDSIHSKLSSNGNKYLIVESKHLNESIKPRQLDVLLFLDSMCKQNPNIQYYGCWISFCKFSAEKGYEEGYIVDVSNLGKVYVLTKDQYTAFCSMDFRGDLYNQSDKHVIKSFNEYILVKKEIE